MTDLKAALIALTLLVPDAALAADCSDWNTPEFFKTASLKTVTDCLDAGANIEARAEMGLTPLHGAAEYGTAETVTTLISAGANSKAQTENGETPFDAAKGNDKLKLTAAYWRLNQARFE